MLRQNKPRVFFALFLLLAATLSAQSFRRILTEVPGQKNPGVSDASITDDKAVNSRIQVDDITLLRHGNQDLWTILETLGAGSGGGVELPEDAVIFIEDISGTLQFSGQDRRFTYTPSTNILRVGETSGAPAVLDLGPFGAYATNPMAIFGNPADANWPGIQIQGIGDAITPGFLGETNATATLVLYSARGTTDSLEPLEEGDFIGAIQFLPNGVANASGEYIPGIGLPDTSILVSAVEVVTTGTYSGVSYPAQMHLGSVLFGASINIGTDGEETASPADLVTITGWADVTQTLQAQKGIIAGSSNAVIALEGTHLDTEGVNNIVVIPPTGSAFVDGSGVSSKDDRVIIGDEITFATGHETDSLQYAVAIGKGAKMARKAIHINSSHDSGSEVDDFGVVLGSNNSATGQYSFIIGHDNTVSGEVVGVIGRGIESGTTDRDNTFYLGADSASFGFTEINLNGGPFSRSGGFTTWLQTGGLKVPEGGSNASAGDFVIRPGQSTGTGESGLLLHSWLPSASGATTQTLVGASIELSGGNAAINDSHSNDVSLRVGAFNDEKTVLELTQDVTGTNITQMRDRTEFRRINTTNATATQIWASDVPAIDLPNSVVFVKATFLIQGFEGGQSGSAIGAVGSLYREATFDMDGTDTMVGTYSQTYDTVDAALTGVDADLSIDGGGSIQATVEGLANNDISWGVKVEYMFMGLNPES